MLTWLQLSGGTFPTGGFNHSYGLETYIQFQKIKTTEDLRKLLNVQLSLMKDSDTIFVKEAYQAMKKNDEMRLIHINDYYTAIKIETELYNASIKTGRALLKGLIPIVAESTAKTLTKIEKLNISHYPILYGVVSSLLMLDLKDTIYTYLYSSLSNLVHVATRIMPLGQSQAQLLLSEIRKDMFRETYDYEKLTLENVSTFNPGLQIASMEHETLYSRLCMS